MFHQFKCESLFKDPFVHVADPMCVLIWKNHDDMMKSLYDLDNKWTRIVNFGDERAPEYESDRKIQRIVGNKLKYLSKLC